jgi:hypothetical protein
MNWRKSGLMVKLFCCNEDIPQTLCRILSVPIPTRSAQKYGSGNSNQHLKHVIVNNFVRDTVFGAGIIF